MRKFGLIGYPLGHSFSKKYFTEKFIGENISDSVYENYPLESLSSFPDLIRNNPELCGLNVTIPYKTDIISFIDDCEPAIEDIGAVNVLKITRSKGRTRISGYNSDVKGISDSVSPYITKKVTSALVLGTGGSSKAVKYTLRKLGLNVTLVSRIRKHETICYDDITDNMLRETSLIVNTTPLGMFPDTGSSPELNYNILNKNHILFDLVYNPEFTAFLIRGQERGCTIITGLKMLRSQAERSWEIWNNEDLM